MKIKLFSAVFIQSPLTQEPVFCLRQTDRGGGQSASNSNWVYLYQYVKDLFEIEGFGHSIRGKGTKGY